MFGKLQRTAEMNSEGLGMGLMICQKLVEQNDGTIEVHSDGRDMGSMFSFSMKMQMPSQTSPMQQVNTKSTGDLNEVIKTIPQQQTEEHKQKVPLSESNDFTSQLSLKQPEPLVSSKAQNDDNHLQFEPQITEKVKSQATSRIEVS